jgi:ribosomal protein S18 acetylase RimI-like enzyme
MRDCAPVIAVRPAALAEVPACARLAALWSGGDPDDYVERLRVEVKSADRLLVVAATAQGVVGYGRAGPWVHPAEPAPDIAPEGWYLGGIVIDPAWRRRGLGRALTVARLDWLAGRADEVWCFVRATNAPSLALHEALGFREVTRDFSFPGVSFDDDGGVLLRLDLPRTP